MKTRWNLISKFSFYAVALLVVAGCTAKNDRSSKLVIRLPSANDLRGKVSTSSSDFDLACFAVNISGSDIPTTKAPTTCDLPTGVFAGLAAPGSELSLSVPRGTRRSLEIFAYFRASATEPCRSAVGGFGTLNRTKIVRVGRVDAFDVLNDEVSVEVSISAPAAGTSIITQYSLPAVCTATAAPTPTGTSFAKVTAGSAVGTTLGGYKFKARVTDSSGYSPTAGGYKFRPRWSNGN